MNPANHDITINKGENFVFHVIYLQENDTGINLESTTAVLGIKRTKYDDSYLAYFTSTPHGCSFLQGNTYAGFSGGIRMNRNFGNTGGLTGGIFVYTGGSTAAFLMPSGQAFYDMYLTDSTGTIKLIEGRAEIIGEVTR